VALGEHGGVLEADAVIAGWESHGLLLCLGNSQSGLWGVPAKDYNIL
jgi:hypothetical protein